MNAIKKSIKYVFCFVLYYSGIIVLLRSIQRRDEAFRILVYHRVGGNPEGSSPWVSARMFRQQIKYLKEHYRIVALNETAESLKADKRIASCSVAITFDDGYRVVFTNAYPITKELNVPVTLFLTSGCIGNSKIPWADAVYFAFKDKNNLRNFYNFRERLKTISDEERIKITEGLNTCFKNDLMLGWEEILEFSRDDNVEIGSHTRNHPVLTNMEIDEARKEILESKKDIEQKISRRIRGFSYPVGKLNQSIKDLVKQSGYDFACAVGNKANNLNEHIYNLKRITVQNLSFVLRPG